MSTRGDLRQLLAADGTWVVPGVTDPLTARLAEAAGARVLFSTGSGISNKWFGLPDLGLASLTEVVEVTGRIAGATSLPLLADADTGYGNHLNVFRTVREFETAGAAGVVLEDQTTPKRCGRFADKSLVDPEEMVDKVRAAVKARRDPELVIVARTDALGVEGLAGAVERGRRYLAAGAELLFVEAGSDEDAVAQVPAAVGAPCMVNVAENAPGSSLDRDRLEGVGYKFALFSNVALHIEARAVKKAFEELLDTGSSAGLRGQMLGWDERQQLAGLPYWEALEREVTEESVGGG